jgi:hypothetical protein
MTMVSGATSNSSGDAPVIQIKPGSVEVRAMACAHALVAAMRLVEKAGEGEVNPSIVKAVDQHMQTVLSSIKDEFTARRVALFAMTAGDAALSRCEAPNEATRCLAVAYAVLKMVEGKMVDPETTLAATALGMAQEAETDNDPAWKNVTSPRYYGQRFMECLVEELRKF